MANALAEFFNVALQVAHLTQRPVDFNASCLAFLFRASAVVAACAWCRAGLVGVLCVRQVPAALLRSCGAGRLFVRRGARRRGPFRPPGGRNAAPAAGGGPAPPARGGPPAPPHPTTPPAPRAAGGRLGAGPRAAGGGRIVPRPPPEFFLMLSARPGARRWSAAHGP